MTACALTLMAGQSAMAFEPNCQMTQSTTWINHEGQAFETDTFVLHEEAETTQACEHLCTTYVEDNILPNVDLFDAIGYACLFEQDTLFENQHEP